MNKKITEYVGSFVRHGLTTAAGFIAGKGIVTAEVANQAATQTASAWEPLIGAAVVWGAGQLWSLARKFIRK